MRHFARQFKFIDGMQQSLRAPHGKDRNHGHTASGGQAMQSGPEFSQQVFFRVLAVAVGGLNEHSVCCWCTVWWVEHQVIGAA